MATLKIITYPDERLLKKAQKIKIFDENLENFVKDMIETMIKNDGCGLASIQVEDDPRFVFEIKNGYRNQPDVFIISPTENEAQAIINAEILKYHEEEMQSFNEGCLSIPNAFLKIERPLKIDVRYQTIKGEVIEKTLEKFEAVVFMHEYDHNQGILYPNRANKEQEEEFWKNYEKQSYEKQ